MSLLERLLYIRLWDLRHARSIRSAIPPDFVARVSFFRTRDLHGQSYRSVICCRASWA